MPKSRLAQRPLAKRAQINLTGCPDFLDLPYKNIWWVVVARLGCQLFRQRHSAGSRGHGISSRPQLIMHPSIPTTGATTT
ncbi:hypothetical protein PCANC_11185 [Puccinia coronata f. sp. avenae]|uniref:Uncharacterized protein n=1 Tax=Puccinia coronata f. sp. avenae TaxID=200324 RepID=A0A2N5URC7_9BASI|nr:hypothetical protein PCANC_11185 [Puccinia coronata f. sp. avenae]